MKHSIPGAMDTHIVHRVGFTGFGTRWSVCRELEQQRELFDGVICRHPTEVTAACRRLFRSLRR
jgi:hypothetical protein